MCVPMCAPRVRTLLLITGPHDIGGTRPDCHRSVLAPQGDGSRTRDSESSRQRDTQPANHPPHNVGSAGMLTHYDYPRVWQAGVLSVGVAASNRCSVAAFAALSCSTLGGLPRSWFMTSGVGVRGRWDDGRLS